VNENVAVNTEKANTRWAGHTLTLVETLDVDSLRFIAGEAS